MRSKSDSFRMNSSVLDATFWLNRNQLLDSRVVIILRNIVAEVAMYIGTVQYYGNANIS